MANLSASASWITSCDFSRAQNPWAARCFALQIGQGHRSREGVGCATVRHVFRQSIEPGLIVTLQLLQISNGVVPSLKAAATICGSAVTERRRALCLLDSVTGLPLWMGHGVARQRFWSWPHRSNIPWVGTALIRHVTNYIGRSTITHRRAQRGSAAGRQA
jgi:hypothetical protein